MNLSDVYLHCVRDVLDLYAGADDERLSAPIRFSPQWHGQQLLCHLAGASSDLATGRLDGAPSPAWTARQVKERAGSSVSELSAELAGNAETVASQCVERSGPVPAWDVSVHTGDLYESWSLPTMPGGLELGWSPVLVDCLHFLSDRGALAGGLVTTSGDTWGALTGNPTVVTSDYELFRALFGRRSRSAIADNVAVGDPEVIVRAVLFEVPDPT